MKKAPRSNPRGLFICEKAVSRAAGILARGEKPPQKTAEGRHGLFFCISQRSAAWLLEKHDIRDALVELLRRGALQHEVKYGAFVEGPVRVIYDEDQDLLAFSNVDYATGLQDEGVGLIRIDGDDGLCAHKSMLAATFERALFVVNQRLRNLVFESSYFHQGPFTNGGHKVLAGRGTDAREYSLGYYEQPVSVGKASVKAIVVVGPVHDWETASEAAVSYKPRIGVLAAKAIALSQGRAKVSRVLPDGALAQFRALVTPVEDIPLAAAITARASALSLSTYDVYATLNWTYEQWIGEETTLSGDQRRILFGDAVLRHPLRIIGPAGAGKTLLMQLMVMRRLHAGGPDTRILYVTHNDAMEVSVRERFRSLAGNRDIPAIARVQITTLSRLTKELLNLDDLQVLESDALAAKTAQRELIKDAFLRAAHLHKDIVDGSPVLSTIQADVDSLIEFVRADISIAIKGNRKESDRQGYTGSERALGRLHGIMDPDERRVIFDTFEIYQADLDALNVVDSDDIAITYLSQVSTPLWGRRRRSLGFDFIFIDEAQLFSENEQKIFPYLSKGTATHAPIVLALDEAQQFYGEPKTGLALLGLPDVSREKLSTNERMSEAVANLAFFVIGHSDDLFSLEFPDFDQYRDRDSRVGQGRLPVIEMRKPETKSLARAVVNRVRALRRSQMRQIAVVCHSEAYWTHLVETLTDELSDLDLSLLTERGTRLSRDHAFAVLTRPSVVGGQEFDAVICVGLEKGLVPRAVPDDAALQAALEQQALRDIYLSVSRARHLVYAIIESESEPTPILAKAAEAGLMVRE